MDRAVQADSRRVEQQEMTPASSRCRGYQFSQHPREPNVISLMLTRALEMIRAAEPYRVILIHGARFCLQLRFEFTV